MPTVIARDIIRRASILLQDQESNIRWTLDEMTDWLNDGQREVTLYKPNACVINTDMQLVIGTKQSIPDSGVALVDLPRNSNGSAIRIVSREVLDAQVPDWHSASKANSKVLHYCFVDTDPKHFYVYPPSPGGNSVEIIYNALPANAAIDSVISIDDIYASALVDYLVYRGYSKDTKYTANASNAVTHYNAFLTAIKGKAMSEVATDPNVRSKGNPNVIS